MTFLFFDVETTGLPRDYTAPVSRLQNWPRLVQIAWLLCDESENCLDGRSQIIKPAGFSIPKAAVRIHGITTERALNEGVPLSQALNEFSTAISRSDYVIAHNIGFDSKIVGAEFIRENIQNRLFQTPHICTMKSSTDFCRLPGPYGYKWPNLTELYSVLFDEPFAETHNALADVAACARCFFQLQKRGIITLHEP